MVIQPIPAFKGKKSHSTTQASNNATQSATKPSGSGPGLQSTKNAEAAKADGAAANKLNVNATSFRPNPKAVAFTPVISHRRCPCMLADTFDRYFRLHRTRQWVRQRTRRLRTNLKVYVDFYMCVTCRPLISLKPSTSIVSPNSSSCLCLSTVDYSPANKLLSLCRGVLKFRGITG